MSNLINLTRNISINENETEKFKNVAPPKKRPYVQGSVKANTSGYNDFNLWQSVYLQNNFNETLRTTVKMRHVSDPRLTAFPTALIYSEVDFVLLGYTHMKHIVLTYTKGYIQRNAIRSSNNVQSIFKDKSSITAQSFYRYLVEFAGIDVQVGNNSFQVVNPSICGDYSHLRIPPLLKKKTQLEYDIMAQFGISHDRMTTRVFTTASDERTPINSSLNCMHASGNNTNEFLYSAESLCPGAKYHDMWNDNLKNNLEADGQCKLFSIPLYMLVPFFDQEAYLPPGTPIKIKFNWTKFYSFNDPLLEAHRNIFPFNKIAQYNNTTGLKDIYALSENIDCLDTISPKFVVKPELRYQYQLMPETVNRHFNELFSKTPLNYAWLDYSVYTAELTDCTGVYKTELTFGNNKPIDIAIQLFPAFLNRDNNTNDNFYTAFPTYNEQKNFSQRKFIGFNYQHSITNGQLTNVLIKKFKLFINDNLVRDLNMNISELGFGAIVPQTTAHDVIEIMKEKNAMWSSQCQMHFSENASFFKVHISENDWLNNKIINYGDKALNKIVVEIELDSTGKCAEPLSDLTPAYKNPVLPNSLSLDPEYFGIYETITTPKKNFNNKVHIYVREQRSATLDYSKILKTTTSPNYFKRRKLQ